MTTRRDVLKGLAVGAAAASVSGVAVATKAPSSLHLLPNGQAPWWLLAPFAQGSVLGLGWYISGLSAVRQGAAVLSLAHTSGRLARVHLCGHAGNPRGVAHTALLDLVLMDGHAGDRRTQESLGRVLLGLARHIANTELDPQGDLRPLARMLTHHERVAAYGPQALLDHQNV